MGVIQSCTQPYPQRRLEPLAVGGGRVVVLREHEELGGGGGGQAVVRAQLVV
jgi:hypothetical protein